MTTALAAVLAAPGAMCRSWAPRSTRCAGDSRNMLGNSAQAAAEGLWEFESVTVLGLFCVA
jgi:hypothetical protein